MSQTKEVNKSTGLNTKYIYIVYYIIYNMQYDQERHVRLVNPRTVHINHPTIETRR
jgi:hypothetical protein